MLPILLYVALAAIVVGTLMAQNSSGQQGWCLLTVPMAAVMIGLPTAYVLSQSLPSLVDPLLGLSGEWRAMIVGLLMGIGGGLIANYVSRNPKRRRRARELAGPLLLFAFVGVLLGLAWAVAHWLVG